MSHAASLAMRLREGWVSARESREQHGHSFFGSKLPRRYLVLHSEDTVDLSESTRVGPESTRASTPDDRRSSVADFAVHELCWYESDEYGRPPLGTIEVTAATELREAAGNLFIVASAGGVELTARAEDAADAGFGSGHGQAHVGEDAGETEQFEQGGLATAVGSCQQGDGLLVAFVG